MPTRELLPRAQRGRFLALPEMDARELARHHTLSDADLTAISIRRGAANRLGFAVQLCLLRFPGRPLRSGQAVPHPIVEFVASQAGPDPDAFADYAGGPEGTGRDTTRREHVAEIVRTFDLCPFDAAAYRELSRWLLPVAEDTDSGETLVRGHGTMSGKRYFKGPVRMRLRASLYGTPRCCVAFHAPRRRNCGTRASAEDINAGSRIRTSEKAPSTHSGE